MEMARTVLALSALCLAAACGRADAGQAPVAAAAKHGALPAMLDDGWLAARTFDERFDNFDYGADQTPGANPHRWRTVMGYGGITAFGNRKVSGSSVAVDPAFPGVENGKLGTTPLGLDPFEVDPGKSLTILARETPPELRSKLWDARYYTGQITTKFSFSQRYGYFEADARLPAGKGFWPAFWLLPVGPPVWPYGGEIDIFEGLGNPRVIYTTLHWAKDHKSSLSKIELPFDASRDFHRYGVAWTKDEIVWYVDRKEVKRVATPPEVDKPMFLLLSFAVGGSWGGYPDETTRFPGRFTIRRIQVWKLQD